MFFRKTSIAVFAGALCGLATGAAAQSCNDGQSRAINIVNSSSQTILNVYGTNPADGWGSDKLPGVLRPGQSQFINFQDRTCTCIMDLKARGDRGGEWTRFKYNVCAATRWQLVD